MSSRDQEQVHVWLTQRELDALLAAATVGLAPAASTPRAVFLEQISEVAPWTWKQRHALATAAEKLSIVRKLWKEHAA